MKYNPIICAVDTADIGQAEQLAAGLAGQVGALKLGLEFFSAHGPDGIRRIAAKKMPIFLDLKFHDIPNTVSKAVKAATLLKPFIMTIHTAGGSAMMKAAADAATEAAAGGIRPMVVGVTVLTSLDQQDLASIGVSDAIADQVKRLGGLAQSSGLDGVVCSPHEIDILRKQCGKDFKLIVPGIRPAGSDMGDQKRVLTPREAMDKGADYLVIGRPITGASDPSEAAKAIAQTL